MPRIVSMISSATEIVHALGALPWLVGRSHECDYPEEVRALPGRTAPRFAVDGDSREIDRLVKRTLAESISVYQVFDDVLERLQPTPMLAQIQWEVCCKPAPRGALGGGRPGEPAGGGVAAAQFTDRGVGRYPPRGAGARNRGERRGVCGALEGAYASHRRCRR